MTFTRTCVVSSLALTALAACSRGADVPSRLDDSNSWAFAPARDAFSPTALLDLRSLNEKVAGESGFVRVSADGELLLANGKPARFWCVNTGVGRDKPWQARPLGPQTEPDLAHHARFLAKRGVNMIRLHSHIEPKPDQPVDAINEGERDWIWRSVAAMKKEGIYTTVSPYWAIPVKVGPSWGIDAGGSENAAALLFFHPKFQDAYKGWLRKLFAEKNPYTGIPLAKDPALAIIQIQNEDSLFFWTINNLKGAPREMLGRQFAQWATRKYGSLDAAKARWEGNSLPGDRADVLDFHNVWEMTQSREGGMKRRLDDQTQFWAETQRNFNREIVRFLREDLGCKQLVNPGNWRTADSARLFDAERWSYTGGDVDAVNRYYTGVHKGPNEGWAIQNGDRFTSPSVLRDPLEFPLNIRQTAGRPMMNTESAWVMPMAYASEGPFLVAAYSSLIGFDGYYWFATGDDEWTPPMSANGYNPSQGKWLFSNPDMLGTFPAAALMYRRGYLKTGQPAVVEHRSLADVFERRTPLIVEEAGYDPNRDMGDVSPRSSVKTAVDPLAFLVGPVRVQYDSDASKSRVLDLSKFIDRKNGVVRSETGQIAMNYGKGFCRVDSPAAQGVAGFWTSQPTQKLSHVTLTGGNAYGAALVVSLDGQPLATSRKVLVQYGTRTRPTDWAEKATAVDVDGGKKVPGFEVVNYGKAPWRVEKAKLEVTILNARLRTARVLDANGQPVRSLTPAKAPGGIRFRFPEDSLYVVLEG